MRLLTGGLRPTMEGIICCDGDKLDNITFEFNHIIRKTDLVVMIFQPNSISIKFNLRPLI